MPQFPEVDPETLLQALRMYVTQRQNVSALQNGQANYLEVMRGWAEAIAATQNPSNAWFQENLNILYELVQGQGGGTSGTLLFNTLSPLQIGQWVYQVSSDTVDLADSTSISTGPAVGVVISAPTKSTVSVLNLGSYLYVPASFPFIPFTPDSTYYIGSAGMITASPNPPSGGYLQEIGYAKNTLQLVLNIQEPTLI
jgi:hypothetical protein